MAHFGYLPLTAEDRESMLQQLSISSTDELFSDIPSDIRLKDPLTVGRSLSEIELSRHLKRMANKNQSLYDVTSFLGAGVYDHYQPSVVESIITRSEFYTSYTPYQPEISQGLLQTTFEYQSMVCELTGMDLANASMYDGPTAFAEAGLVACAHTGRTKLLVSDSVHPEYCRVLETYCAGQSIDIVYIPNQTGRIDMTSLVQQLDDTVAAVMVQYPNFYGIVEDLKHIAENAHRIQALMVVNTYPIALGMIESPGAQGADIVVAEGQSLGISPSFGGPYLGMMAVTKELMRRIPGRIVGETKDGEGRRGFVLTLQTREQHIRREKATSNICSNQSLCAIAATVFLSYMGKDGMRELALQNFHKAHYLHKMLSEVNGIENVFDAPFFNEFVIRVPKRVSEFQDALLDRGYLFGFDLSQNVPQLGDTILVNVTEMRTREEIDGLVNAVREVLQ